LSTIVGSENVGVSRSTRSLDGTVASVVGATGSTAVVVEPEAPESDPPESLHDTATRATIRQPASRIVDGW